MDDAELERSLKAFLKDAEDFRRNAFLIINEMVLKSTHPTTILVDEVLHSIFFLGKINTPHFPQKRLWLMMKCYVHLSSDTLVLFSLYSSEVPRRSPFSCLLDMVVTQAGRDNEVKIIKELRRFVGGLKGRKNKKPLVSKTICVSQSRSPGSVRYYGVSMSTCYEAKTILIGASCLGYWHEYVADAVMTFYPEPGSEQYVRKPYFNGTIRVPEQVRCETFDLYDKASTLVVKPPCRLCRDMFGLGQPNKAEMAPCCYHDNKDMNAWMVLVDPVRLVLSRSCWTWSSRPVGPGSSAGPVGPGPAGPVGPGSQPFLLDLMF
ncbi:uncharacterized protein LOC116685469 [Etheostoma spectabile]|uniref:uncharacterized protein LOC116685469 n=1 Tax=Etheostoma spectabile TaxID=54343 RepID=UPI0013AF8D70|nr:uncharacterized protein LOC116685469 [Etheostoma spectabile]